MNYNPPYELAVSEGWLQSKTITREK